MATNVQITCINKSDRLTPHACIHSVGGTYANGKRWRLTQEETIACIENGNRAFYASIDGKSVPVAVGVGPHGDKYLKAIDDGGRLNDLLKLPECPG